MTSHPEVKLTTSSRALLWALFLICAWASHVWVHEESGPVRWAIRFMVDYFDEVSRKIIWTASALTGLAIFAFGAIVFLRLGIVRSDPPEPPGVIGAQWLLDWRTMLARRRWSLMFGLLGLELCMLGISTGVTAFLMGPPEVCNVEKIAKYACDDSWAHFPGTPSYSEVVLAIKAHNELTEYLQLQGAPHVYIARERYESSPTEPPQRLISGHVRRMPWAHYLLLKNVQGALLPAHDDIRVLDSEDFVLGAAFKAVFCCLVGLSLVLVARWRLRKPERLRAPAAVIGAA